MRNILLYTAIFCFAFFIGNISSKIEIQNLKAENEKLIAQLNEANNELLQYDNLTLEQKAPINSQIGVQPGTYLLTEDLSNFRPAGSYDFYIGEIGTTNIYVNDELVGTLCSEQTDKCDDSIHDIVLEIGDEIIIEGAKVVVKYEQ